MANLFPDRSFIAKHIRERSLLVFIILLVAAALPFLFFNFSEQKNPVAEKIRSLRLLQSSELKDATGLVKIAGKPIALKDLLTPPKPKNEKPVLYYSYLIREFEAVPYVPPTPDPSVVLGSVTPEASVAATPLPVEKWVTKLDDKQWAKFRLGQLEVDPKKAQLYLDLVTLFEEKGGTGEKISVSPIVASPEVTAVITKKREEAVSVLPISDELLVIGNVSDGSVVRDGDPFIITNKSESQLLRELQGTPSVLAWLLRVGALLFFVLFFYVVGLLFRLQDKVPVLFLGMGALVFGVVFDGMAIVVHPFLALILIIVIFVGVLVGTMPKKKKS
ncbi:MAG: GIDE domain-containing protein [bacterium]